MPMLRKHHIRMPDKLWLKVPLPNRSKWIRDAITQRLSRDVDGIENEDFETLKNSSEQLRKVGFNLSQVVRLLHCGKSDASALPLNEIILAIRQISKDVNVIKTRYIIKD